MQFWDSDALVIRTFEAENAVFYGTPGFNFRINKEFVKFTKFGYFLYIRPASFDASGFLR